MKSLDDREHVLEHPLGDLVEAFAARRRCAERGALGVIASSTTGTS